jgi:hypothetical protein
MKTHDYSRERTGWGNDYAVTSVIDGGKQIKLSGWGLGISSGDFLILQNGNDTTRYQVDEINYLGNPKDMWRASATFAPRQNQQEHE